LGVVRLLCSDTLHVRLCRLGPASPRWMFSSLLGGEGGQLQGLTRGHGSHPVPGGHGKLVFLCHALCVNLSQKWPHKATRRAWRLGTPKPRWHGACLLALGPWLVLQVGQEPRPELECVVDQELKARASPQALCEGCAMPKLGQVSSSKGAREHTRWV
jgi:hypothetical protein